MSKRGAAAAAAGGAVDEPLKPSKRVLSSQLGRAYIMLDKEQQNEKPTAVEKRWNQLPAAQQNKLICDTVRYIVLSATSGCGSLSESKLKSTVLSVHGDIDISGRCLIDKSRDKLRDTFGWELVAARKTLTTGKLTRDIGF